MANINKLWAGGVYGTNTGNLFIELNNTDPNITGTLRFMDSAFGLTIYSIEGSYDGETLSFIGCPKTKNPGIELGQLTAQARLTPEGYLRGTWATTLGTGGTFEAFPHDITDKQNPTRNRADIPEQLYTRNISLGAVRLFYDDVIRLLEHMQKDFLTDRITITFRSEGNEVTKYADTFLLNAKSLGTLKYFKAMIQEPEAHGINRLTVVELNAFGTNEVRVQGIQESWVIGKAESIASLLKSKQSSLITTYKKFGLNLNQIIFATMLVVMPSIKNWIERALFAVSVFILLMLLLWLHARFIPNATVQMEIESPSYIVRAWPTILSWIVASTASLVAALVFYWITRGSS